AFKQAGDSAFGRADGAVQQEHAALGAIALSRGFKGVDQLDKGAVQAIDAVAMLDGKISEEVVADNLLLVFINLLGAMRKNHVVKALIRRTRHVGVFADDVQILLETPLPVL